MYKKSLKKRTKVRKSIKRLSKKKSIRKRRSYKKKSIRKKRRSYKKKSRRKYIYDGVRETYFKNITSLSEEEKKIINEEINNIIDSEKKLFKESLNKIALEQLNDFFLTLKNDEIELYKYLIFRNEKKEREEETLFHNLCFYNCFETIKIICKKLGDKRFKNLLNIKDKRGYSPIFYISGKTTTSDTEIYEKYKETITYLLDKDNSIINHQTIYKETVLIICFLNTLHTTYFEKLFEFETDKNKKGIELVKQVMSNNIDLFMLLLSYYKKANNNNYENIIEQIKAFLNKFDELLYTVSDSIAKDHDKIKNEKRKLYFKYATLDIDNIKSFIIYLKNEEEKAIKDAEKGAEEVAELLIKEEIKKESKKKKKKSPSILVSSKLSIPSPPILVSSESLPSLALPSTSELLTGYIETNTSKKRIKGVLSIPSPPILESSESLPPSLPSPPTSELIGYIETNTIEKRIKGVLSITCFFKFNGIDIKSISLHGLWPDDIMEKYDPKTDIYLDDIDIDRNKSYKLSDISSKTYPCFRNINKNFIDWFVKHEWENHGIYANKYENINEYIEESCNLAMPIIKYLTELNELDFNEMVDNIISKSPFKEFYKEAVETETYKDIRFNVCAKYNPEIKKFKWKYFKF